MYISMVPQHCFSVHKAKSGFCFSCNTEVKLNAVSNGKQIYVSFALICWNYSSLAPLRSRTKLMRGKTQNVLLVSAHPSSLNPPSWLPEARPKLEQVHPQTCIFYSCCGVQCLVSTALEPNFFSFHKDSLITRFL